MSINRRINRDRIYSLFRIHPIAVSSHNQGVLAIAVIGQRHDSPIRSHIVRVPHNGRGDDIDSLVGRGLRNNDLTFFVEGSSQVVQLHRKRIGVVLCFFLDNDIFLDIQSCDNVFQINAGENIVVDHRSIDLVQRSHFLQLRRILTKLRFEVGDLARNLFRRTVKRQRQLAVTVMQGKQATVAGRLLGKFDLGVARSDLTTRDRQCVVDILPVTILILIVDGRIILGCVITTVFQTEILDGGSTHIGHFDDILLRGQRIVT